MHTNFIKNQSDMRYSKYFIMPADSMVVLDLNISLLLPQMLQWHRCT